MIVTEETTLTDVSEWTVRALQVFDVEGIVTFGDLIRKSEQELLRTPNFGRKTLNDVKAALARYGMHIGGYMSGPANADVARLDSQYAEIQKHIGQLREQIILLEKFLRDNVGLVDAHYQREIQRKVITDRVRGLDISAIASKHDLTSDQVKRICIIGADFIEQAVP